MLMLITLLTDGALISVGYDIVKPNPLPEQWNIVRLFILASVMGGVSLGACILCMHTQRKAHSRPTAARVPPPLSLLECFRHKATTHATDSPRPSQNTGSSLLLLAAGLDSNNPNGMYAGLGLPPIEYGKVITSIFLKVSVSEFLTLFSCRTQEGFFWTVKPGKPLVAAVAISLIISSFLASFWPKGTLDGLPVMGLALGNCPLLPLWIWIYCILWWFVQDLAKVVTLAFLNYFHIFPNTLADMAPFEKALENVV